MEHNDENAAYGSPEGRARADMPARRRAAGPSQGGSAAGRVRAGQGGYQDAGARHASHASHAASGGQMPQRRAARRQPQPQAQNQARYDRQRPVADGRDPMPQRRTAARTDAPRGGYQQAGGYRQPDGGQQTGAYRTPDTYQQAPARQQAAPYRPVAVPATGGDHHYHGDDIVRVRKKRKSHRVAKRVAIIVAAVLVVLIGAAAAFGIWYTSTLAGNMAMNEEDSQKLDAALGGTVSDVAQEPFYMLIMGSDNWETYGERSDAMILTRIDPVKHVVTMVSVPRDTPYMLNGNKVKINQAFAEQGPAGAVTAVQELTGVDVSYYAEIEFAGLAEFIDSIGGIYVDVPYAIDYQVYTHDQAAVHLDAGEQLLDGEQCVALARSRTDYNTDQDAIRQSNIRAMVLALMNSVLQSPPAEIPGLVQGLSECISTNMELSQMMSLATDFAGSGGATVYTCTGPYKGDIDAETGLWLCYEDPEGWADLMKAVDAGENPETVSNQVEGK